MIATKGNVFLGTVKRVAAQRDRMARRVAGLARAARPTSDPQKALLRAIESLTAELGRGPSTVELAAFTGMTRGGIRATLERLERGGLIADVPKQVRSGRWGVTEKGRERKR